MNGDPEVLSDELVDQMHDERVNTLYVDDESH